MVRHGPIRKENGEKFGRKPTPCFDLTFHNIAHYNSFFACGDLIVVLRGLTYASVIASRFIIFIKGWYYYYYSYTKKMPFSHEPMISSFCVVLFSEKLRAVNDLEVLTVVYLEANNGEG